VRGLQIQLTYQEDFAVASTKGNPYIHFLNGVVLRPKKHKVKIPTLRKEREEWGTRGWGTPFILVLRDSSPIRFELYEARASRRISLESSKYPRPRAKGMAPNAPTVWASGSTLAIRVKVSM
jgi:hypothetical protein